MSAPALNRARAGTRGILHPHVSRRHYSLERLPPRPELRFFVQQLWVVEWDLSEPFTALVLPHPNSNLCVMAGRSRISGVGRRVFAERLQGTGRVVGVTYRPGGLRALHDAPARSLTGADIAVSAVYDVDVAALEELVLSADVPTALDRIQDLLRSRIPARDGQADLVGDIVDAVVGDRSLGRVEQVAGRFALSVRRLQRLFADYVGVTPKWVLMRARLHDATDAVGDGTPPDWARLAAELGYCDQAHLVRAFTSVLGISPGEYVRRSVDRS